MVLQTKKGFLIRVVSFDGERILRPDRQTLSEAIYKAKKYEKIASHIQITINNYLMWEYAKETGERNMTNFEEAVENSERPPFMKRKLKSILIEEQIPFAVNKVNTGNKSTIYEDGQPREVVSSHLYIEFDPDDYEYIVGKMGNKTKEVVKSSMILSFEEGYESRDRIVQALQKDTENGTFPNAILVTFGTFQTLRPS